MKQSAKRNNHLEDAKENYFNKWFSFVGGYGEFFYHR